MKINVGAVLDSFPDLLLAPVATAAQMRDIERKSIEEMGIPSAVLMENAARATIGVMVRRFGPLRGKSLAVFAGPGNNGGDGLAIARAALARGAQPCIWLCADPEKLPPDAALTWGIAQKLGLPCRVLSPEEPLPADWAELLPNDKPLHSVVDALFGIGLTRPLSGLYLEAVWAVGELARRHACPVVAADIPTGVHTDTGEPLGEADGTVRARLTVAYGLPKPGHVHKGDAHCGEVLVVDIGIPPQVLAQANLPGRLIDHNILRALPHRPANTHKGANGHVLVLAGSNGMSGAGILAAKGVLAAGAGLLTCALPRDLAPMLATALPEALYEPLPAHDHLSHEDLPAISALCRGKEAILVGPGLGQHADTAALVRALYLARPEPMILDADALNILASSADALDKPGGPRVFTPHPGEMARLLGVPIPDIQRDRLTAAQSLCTLCGSEQPVVAVLKGAGTVLAASDGLWALNTSGNSGMATGGMGDVLSGVMAGLLAQGHDLWLAARAAVWLHGAAGDLLAKKRPFGYTASEVAAAVPRIIFGNTED